MKPSLKFFIYSSDPGKRSCVSASAPKAKSNHWTARYGYKSSAKEVLEHAKYSSGNERYACVSLTNYDTIEFRAFQGMLKLNTLQFVDCICRLALALSESEIKNLS